MIFLQANWILAFVCAFTYYQMGGIEAREGRQNHGMLWAGLSVAASAMLIQWLHAGWLLVLFGQVGLFIGITVFRALRED